MFYPEYRAYCRVLRDTAVIFYHFENFCYQSVIFCSFFETIVV
nr:MAG TPA: hypothetical protein [Caudoviricetes sp.]